MKLGQIKVRVMWGFNPVTRRVLSKKSYKRSRAKEELKRAV